MADAPETNPTTDAPSPDSPNLFEERLLALPGLDQFNVPGEFIRFFEEIAPKLYLPDSLKQFLEPQENADVLTKLIVSTFKGYPEDYLKFIEMVRVMHEKEEKELNNESIIRLYGIENTRVFLFAVAVIPLITGKKFDWDPRFRRPKLEPKELLNHAIKTEHSYSGRASNLAFAAGLTYDLLLLIACKVKPTENRKLLEFIQHMALQGVETARIGIAISRKARDLKLAQYVFSTCVLQGLGKAAMAILNEEYIDFSNRMIRDDMPYSIRILCERTRFGFSSDLLGSLICQYFPVFHPIQEAIYFQRQPHLLKSVAKMDLFNLAAVSCLASHIAWKPLTLEGPEDPRIIERWKRPEVQDLEISPAEIFVALEGLK